jgi:PKD repeat protein
MAKPIAAFSATPLTGECPSTVVFTDESTNTPTQRFRDFGDGNTSLEQNPTNIYYKPGAYDVTLRVSNAGSTEDVLTKTAYVNPVETDEGQTNLGSIDEARRGRRSFPPFSTDVEPVPSDRETIIDYAEDGSRTDHQDIFS